MHGFTVPRKCWIRHLGFIAFVLSNLIGCSTLDKTSKLKCHTYILAPAFHSDQKISDRISNIWKAKKKKYFKKCDKFVPRAKAKEIFSLLNIDNTKKIKRKDFGKQQIKRIVDKSKASRLVVFSTKTKKARVVIKGKIFNLVPFKEIKKKGLSKKFTSKIRAKNYIASRRSIKTTLLNLIPNSVTINIVSASKLSDDLELKDYEITSSESNSATPKIISSIGVTNVTHPFGFDLFDFSFNSFATISFYAVDQSLTLSKETSSPEEESVL